VAAPGDDASGFLLFFNALRRQDETDSENSMSFAESKILAQKHCRRLWAMLPKRVLMAVAALFLLPTFSLITAFGVASDTQLDKLARHDVIQQLALPTAEEAVFSLPAETAYRFSDRVQRGDTVAELLRRLGVDDPAAFNFLRTDKSARSIFQLRPGRTVQAVVNENHQLQSFRYLHSSDKYLQVTREAGGFRAQEVGMAPTVHQVFKSGVIRSSLYGATDAAGIPDAIANQMARIFSTDIDFHIDLRKGDRFAVVYEMLHQDGELLGPGRVLSAEFGNRGKTFEAYLFTDGDGSEGYYSADGQNRAKSFLRSALAFSRVSSGFGGRFHPLLRNWRQHTGVDFAAPRGTPIWATADGVVEFAGVKGGYGNVIEVRHMAGITTLYAHMSGFANGVRRGTRVSQGQIIGYVGATGWATGPHLHYEFKVSGIHQDPLRVALPKAEPLDARYLAAFTHAARLQGEQLALLRDTAFGRFE
jgi:murein DD-endopeptidase MepM/ murein hydrolase activator NlpD